MSDSQRRRPEIFVIFLTIFVSMVGFGIVIPVLPDYGRNAPLFECRLPRSAG